MFISRTKRIISNIKNTKFIIPRTSFNLIPTVQYSYNNTFNNSNKNNNCNFSRLLLLGSSVPIIALSNNNAKAEERVCLNIGEQLGITNTKSLEPKSTTDMVKHLEINVAKTQDEEDEILNKYNYRDLWYIQFVLFTLSAIFATQFILVLIRLFMILLKI